MNPGKKRYTSKKHVKKTLPDNLHVKGITIRTRRQMANNVTTSVIFDVIHFGDPPFKKAGEDQTMSDLYTTAPTQIVMYATEYCPDCTRAKKFLEANHIPYLRVGLEGNTEATEFVIKVNRGYKSVPTIFFPDGSILVEPNLEELKAKFMYA